MALKTHTHTYLYTVKTLLIKFVNKKGLKIKKTNIIIIKQNRHTHTNNFEFDNNQICIFDEMSRKTKQ